MRKILLLLSFLLSVCVLLGQDVTVESTTEEMDSTKFSRLLNSYNRIIMAEREELTLIKVDLLGPLLFSMSGMDTTIHNIARVSFEQKFKPEWSWVAALEAQANKTTVTEARVRGGVRYYFNMQKRILKGKSANNFSANYLSARLNYKRDPVANDDHISLDLLFGIQRRLWKIGYVDFDIGLENLIQPFEDQEPGVNITSSIQLGIAF